jgi:hypothetical protein
MASLSRTLLVVCPEGPALRVFTCVARFWGWSLGRVEVVALASGELQAHVHQDVQPALQPEVIAAAVRPLALRWSIPPGTEVALVLPAVVGGVLSLVAGALHREADRAWIETELAGRIPFALGDIEYEARPSRVGVGVAVGHDRSIEVAWLPRTIAMEFRTAFARLGLALGEIVFRPQLFASAARFASAGRGTGVEDSELVIEQWAGSCYFHLLAGGSVLRTSIAQTPAPREFADRLQLELLSLRAAGHNVSAAVAPAVSRAVSRIVLTDAQRPFNSAFEAAAKDAVHGIKIERRAAEISAMFLRFWRDGATGIWLVPEDPPPLAMARRLAFAVAGCGVLLAAAMGWHTSAIRDETTALEARAARLRPQYQPLVAKERQAVSAAAAADAVARLSAPPREPQAALLSVFNALPRSAWVTRFYFEAGKTTIAGRGLDTESVIAGLKSQPGVSRIVAESGAELELTDRGAEPHFRVWFHWAPGVPGAAPGRADENADDKKRKAQ